MPIDLKEEKTLAGRPRLKATCIKLHDIAQEWGPDAKLPTIAELKAALGVSVYTLNDAVRELERRQILRSVNGVGIYVTPHQRTWTGNIGIVGNNSLSSPQLEYYHLLMRGIEEQTQSHHQHLLFLGPADTWDSRSLEKVDGLLAICIDNAHSFVKLIPSPLPAVTVFTAAENYSSVTVDDRQGARLAVEYLLGRGHQRIACLAEEAPRLSQLRVQGYRDALHAAGIDASPAWIRLTPLPHPPESDGQYYLRWGRAQMEQWLKEGWRETGCTALFVQNDTAAIGVMNYLRDAGIKVPEEISIIGFDGTTLCDYVSPRLTSVKIPLMEIGSKAMQLLNAQIAQNHTIQNTVMPLHIREGESVANIS
jgi:DNA-binding LacI/PurR family transcriptional regulator